MNVAPKPQKKLLNARRPRPVQERSRKTEDRILEALRTLAVDREFDDISVAEIASKAGVTQGAVYGRFRSKDAIAEEVYRRDFLSRVESEVLPVLAPENWTGKSIKDVFRQHLEIVVDIYEGLAGSLGRHFYVAMRTPGRDTENRRELHRLNRVITERLTALVLDRRREVGHPEPVLAIQLAEQFVDLLLIQKIVWRLPVEPHMEINHVPDSKLVEEMVRAFTSYLEVKV